MTSIDTFSKTVLRIYCYYFYSYTAIVNHEGNHEGEHDGSRGGCLIRSHEGNHEWNHGEYLVGNFGGNHEENHAGIHEGNLIRSMFKQTFYLTMKHNRRNSNLRFSFVDFPDNTFDDAEIFYNRGSIVNT